MQINSHYPHARGLGTKVGHPTGQTTIARPASRRPRGLARPAVSEAPSQYLGPQAPRIIHPLNAFAQICAKVRKWGFPHVSRTREALRKLMRFLMSILDALSGIHAAIFSNFICARTKGDI